MYLQPDIESTRLVEHKATLVSYVVSGATAGVGIFTASDIAAIGGLVFAALTFCVNWYYRHKHFKLAEEALKAQSKLPEGE